MVNTSNTININPNKVAIYPRWSTDEQTSGTTLETQLTSCKNYILSQGWSVNEDLIFIDDGYSGANLNRPEMTRLREYVQTGKIDCVIVYKLDRLSRNLRDAVNLVMDEWLDKCYLKSVTEPIDTTTPLGKQIFYILMGFAEMEREVIKERTWSGKVVRAKEGKNPGFRVPYGYLNEIGKPGNFILIPEEAKIVKFIFDEYLKGQGLRQIANYLNENGITRRGIAWDFSSISYLLSNPFYYGKLVYGRHSENREWIKHNEPLSSVRSDYIEPIITEEEFKQVQIIKDSKNTMKSRRSGRSYGSPYLLTGLLKCKECNHGLGGLIPSTGRRFYYYVCRGYSNKGRKFCTKSSYINMEVLDDLVYEELKEDFLNKNLDNLLNRFNKQHENIINQVKISINDCEKKLRTINKQLQKIEKDYISGDLPVNIFNRLYDNTIIEKENIELIYKEKNNELQNLNKDIITSDKLSKFNDILFNWNSIPIEDKKNVLKEWISKIIVFKEINTENIELEIEYFHDPRN